MNGLLLPSRLEKLLPHWAAHARDHAAELASWHTGAAATMDPAVTALLAEAERGMADAAAALEAAAAQLAAGRP
jgi:hypothetical protein